jgi:hypothetical protein
MCERSENADSFIAFLMILLMKHEPETTAVFLDNCRVHHAKKVTAFVAEVGL